MTQHTPGPWRVIIDDTGGPFTGWPSIVAPEHIDASVVHRAGFKQQHWGDWSQREALANARLIAAAPDLLVELENALPALYDVRNRFAANGDAVCATSLTITIGRLTAAIARATGGPL